MYFQIFLLSITFLSLLFIVYDKYLDSKIPSRDLFLKGKYHYYLTRASKKRISPTTLRFNSHIKRAIKKAKKVYHSTDNKSALINRAMLKDKSLRKKDFVFLDMTLNSIFLGLNENKSDFFYRIHQVKIYCAAMHIVHSEKEKKVKITKKREKGHICRYCRTADQELKRGLCSSCHEVLIAYD